MSHYIFSKFSDENNLIAMTTRKGGVSSGAYSELNLGINTDDMIENISKNYEIVKSDLKLETVVKLTQVHGNIIHEVTTLNCKDIDMKKGDGLFTTEKNIALAVLTADCFPLVLLSEEAVAVLHCGWRSMNLKIIEEAVSIFHKYNSNVKMAFIGAGISKDIYTVKTDMISQLDLRYSPENCLIKINSEEFKLNLQQLLINALKINKIDNIDLLNLTTSEENFFSYRRDNGVTGRMATIVMRR